MPFTPYSKATQTGKAAKPAAKKAPAKMKASPIDKVAKKAAAMPAPMPMPKGKGKKAAKPMPFANGGMVGKKGR